MSTIDVKAAFVFRRERSVYGFIIYDKMLDTVRKPYSTNVLNISFMSQNGLLWYIAYAFGFML